MKINVKQTRQLSFLICVAILCYLFPAESQVPPEITQTDLSNEMPLVTKIEATSTKTTNNELLYSVNFAQLESNLDRKFLFSISRDVLNKTERDRTRLSLATSLAKRGKNDFYAFDPVYFPQNKLWVFKFGKADGSLDAYRLMSLHDGETKAQQLVNDQLRNKKIEFSANGRYIAFIKGGGANGPDFSYFTKTTELWVYDIKEKKEYMILRSNSVSSSFNWNADNLFYSKEDLTKANNKNPPQTKHSFLKFNPASGLSEIISSGTVPTSEPLLFKDIRYAGFVQGQDIWSEDWLGSTKPPFEMGYFSQGSVWSDSNGAYFFVAIPIQRELVNKYEKTHQMTYWDQEFDLWTFNWKNRTYKKILRLPVQTFFYSASPKILNHLQSKSGSQQEKFLLSVLSVGEELSPVTTPPIEVKTPSHVYSIIEVEGNKSKQIWQERNCAGLSVSINGGVLALHPY